VARSVTRAPLRHSGAAAPCASSVSTSARRARPSLTPAGDARGRERRSWTAPTLAVAPSILGSSASAGAQRSRCTTLRPGNDAGAREPARRGRHNPTPQNACEPRRSAERPHTADRVPTGPPAETGSPFLYRKIPRRARQTRAAFRPEFRPEPSRKSVRSPRRWPPRPCRRHSARFQRLDSAPILCCPERACKGPALLAPLSARVQPGACLLWGSLPAAVSELIQ